jgi:hypothetical protein
MNAIGINQSRGEFMDFLILPFNLLAFKDGFKECGIFEQFLGLDYGAGGYRSFRRSGPDSRSGPRYHFPVSNLKLYVSRERTCKVKQVY